MSIEWGPVSEWVGASLTVGALVAALWLPRWQRSRDIADSADLARRSGLIETRRLLYEVMAYRDQAVPPALLGSLTSALVHHADLVEGFQIIRIELLSREGKGKSRREWLQQLVDQVCDLLGEARPAWIDPDGTVLMRVRRSTNGELVMAQIRNGDTHRYRVVENDSAGERYYELIDPSEQP